ncbi:hypothetical protein V2J09_009802 [Rumex salicifolius]
MPSNSTYTKAKVVKPLDPTSLEVEATKVIQFISNYYRNVESYPVRSQVEPGYLRRLIPSHAPHSPEPLDDILDDVTRHIIPGLTHWQSPNFFAFYQANASNAALLGDLLSSGFNVVGFNWIASPAATELEMAVMDWVARMLALPDQFLFSGGGGGVMYSSTCEAMVCTLAAARDRALESRDHGSITKLVVYCSDQTHFSLQKAAKLVGIPPRNFRAIPCSLTAGGFSLSPSHLAAAMEADVATGLVPLYVCATVGSTATGGADSVEELGRVARRFGAWMHVDAAYGGSACICPEYRHYLTGKELADSISMNAHKWMLTNMDCCCMWVKDPATLVDSLSTNPDILTNNHSGTGEVVDYKDWQVALSRRFRALKLWLVIRMYGLSNLMDHIRTDVELAAHLESLVKKDKWFELVVPRNFALVCFRLKPRPKEGQELDEGGAAANKANRELLESVNASGAAYMTHATVEGKFVIRCAIGGTLTKQRHVDGLWRLIQDNASTLLGYNRKNKERIGINSKPVSSMWGMDTAV